MALLGGLASLVLVSMTALPVLAATAVATSGGGNGFRISPAHY